MVHVQTGGGSVEPLARGGPASGDARPMAKDDRKRQADTDPPAGRLGETPFGRRTSGPYVSWTDGRPRSASSRRSRTISQPSRRSLAPPRRGSKGWRPISSRGRRGLRPTLQSSGLCSTECPPGSTRWRPSLPANTRAGLRLNRSWRPSWSAGGGRHGHGDEGASCSQWREYREARGANRRGSLVDHRMNWRITTTSSRKGRRPRGGTRSAPPTCANRRSSPDSRAGRDRRTPSVRSSAGAA